MVIVSSNARNLVVEKGPWAGVVRWFARNITKTILEGKKSLVHAAKARARGLVCLNILSLLLTKSLVNGDTYPFEIAKSHLS
jgi:predicted RNA-binding protein with PUA-like domain